MLFLPSSPLFLRNSGTGSAGLRLLAAAFLALVSPASGLESIQVPPTQTITHDGQTLIFAWSGDLWASDIAGGESQRLTHHPASDDNPKLARDGQSVFFNSAQPPEALPSRWRPRWWWELAKSRRG